MMETLLPALLDQVRDGDPDPAAIAKETEAIRRSWTVSEHFRRWEMAPADLARRLIDEGHPAEAVLDELEVQNRQAYNVQLLRAERKRSAAIHGWYEVPRG